MLSCFSHVRLHSAMDCSPPSPSVHGICQARILEWIAMPSSRGASQPRDWTLISMSPALAVVFFTTSATWRLSTKILMLSNCGVGEDSWVPWTTRRSNQSVPKEINPEYSLEGLMLKLQYFGHLMWRANSLEKTLMLGRIEGRRRRGHQSTRWLDGITDSMGMTLSKLQETVKERGAWHAAVQEVTKSRIQLSDWTRTINL